MLGVLEFHAGVSYRNILVYRCKEPAPFTKETKGQPPHDIPDKAVAPYLPSGPGCELLNEIMLKSQALFLDHKVNKKRIAEGHKPATQCWLWGMGVSPVLKSLRMCIM